MTDIDKLIEAVEAGTLPEAVFHGHSSIRGHWAYTTGLDADQRRDAFLAYNGSLDAAKRLHDALLPGWIWNVVDSETTVWPGFPGDPRDHQDGYCEGNPARSWLLAILRALKAKG